MTNFTAVFEHLKAGKKVGRSTWDDGTRMYVLCGELVMQTQHGDPRSWILDWDDLTATDWRLH